jgi:ATP-dependent 26S proteasome regulatory subunit
VSASKATASDNAPPSTGAPAFQHELATQMRAGCPVLYVVTHEEDRAIDLIAAAIKGDARIKDRTLFLWSISRGLCHQDSRPVKRELQDPKLILPHILGHSGPVVVVLKDFHAFIDERKPDAALIIRQLRDLVPEGKASRKTVIILSAVLKLPPELEKDVTVLDLDPPDEFELAALVDEMADGQKDNPRVEINLGDGGREKVVKALTGLTFAEAENALAKLLVSRGRLDPADVDALNAEKEQIVRKSETLEFFATPEKFGNIGGLQNLKEWLRRRRLAFDEKARAQGVDAPRGIVLVGVPGCGKSLSAKAVSAEWELPLLKFEMGRVFGSYVGEAEQRMRSALKLAEALAPCVLWVDEIEKGLAGSRGPDGDSGVTKRVFGSFLTWMSDKKKPVFVVATANDVDALPEEFLRKGRFDEVFFVDLPHPQERANILAVHLARRGRKFEDFDLAAHALATEGFSGAELEAVVNDAVFTSLAESSGNRLTDAHLAEAISQTRPQSRGQAERIAQLRLRAEQGWKPASIPPASKVSGAALDEPAPMSKKARRVFDA